MTSESEPPIEKESDRPTALEPLINKEVLFSSISFYHAKLLCQYPFAFAPTAERLGSVFSRVEWKEYHPILVRSKNLHFCGRAIACNSAANSDQGNQADLHKEVQLLFKDAQKDRFKGLSHDSFTTVDGDRGRIEIRRHPTVSDVDWFEEKSRRQLRVSQTASNNPPSRI